MDRQPYIYTMPEEFIKDSEVPAHWRLLALFNGFFISGKPFYATNEWISKQIGLKQWAISSGITKLEQMGKIHTEGKHSKRRVITSTAKLVLTDEPSVATLGNLVDAHLEHSDAPLHTSDSNSDKTGAKTHETFTITEENPKEKKVTPEMQKVFDLFSFNPARLVWKGRVHQREAAKVLFDTFGIFELKQRLAVSQKYRNEPLCPQVDNPADFLEKMPKLETFLKNL